jgi:hypothetical protein
MLYVYGIVRAGHPQPNKDGVGSPPGIVRLVESGPLAAAVTELPDSFDVREEDARAHLHVLIDLLKHGAVLPLRMGTVAPNAEAVRAEVLDVAPDDLVRRLDALAGLVEVHVDADDDETEALAAVARRLGPRSTTAGDINSMLDLGEQVAVLLIERRQRLAEEMLAELRPCAVHDVPRALLQGPEDPVLRWAFLVRRDGLARFDQAVVAVRSRHPSIAVRYVGPLPASHFLDWQQDRELVRETSNFSQQGGWGW